MKLYRHNVLRITSCSDPLLWYADKVGQHVPHEGFSAGSGFRSREESGHVNFVRLDDAKPVTVLVTEKGNGFYPFAAPAPVVKTVGPTGCTGNCERLGICQATCDESVTQKRGQSRRDSAIEAMVNILVGFVVSVLITAVLLPGMGHAVTLADNLLMTSVFTVASLLRSYGLRRAFNWMHHRGMA